MLTCVIKPDLNYHLITDLLSKYMADADKNPGLSRNEKGFSAFNAFSQLLFENHATYVFYSDKINPMILEELQRTTELKIHICDEKCLISGTVNTFIRDIHGLCRINKSTEMRVIGGLLYKFFVDVFPNAFKKQIIMLEDKTFHLG